MANDLEKKVADQLKQSQKIEDYAEKLIKSAAKHNEDKAIYKVAPDEKYSDSYRGTDVYAASGVHTLTGQGRTKIVEKGSKDVVDTAKESYSETDYSKGKEETQHVGRLYGAGTLSRSAVISDLKDEFKKGFDAQYSNEIFARCPNNTDFQNRVSMLDTGSKYTGSISVVKDYYTHTGKVNAYLESYGINTHRMDRATLVALAKNDYELNHITAGITDPEVKQQAVKDLKYMLNEKIRMDGLKNKVVAAKSMKGGFLNTGRAWADEALKDTDVYRGFTYAKGAVYAGRAATWISKGVLTGSAQIVNTGYGAVGKTMERAAKIHEKSAQKLKGKAQLTEREKSKLLHHSRAYESLHGKGAAIIASSDKVTQGISWYAKTDGRQKVKFVAAKGANALAHTKVGHAATEAKNAVKESAKRTAEKIITSKGIYPIAKFGSGVKKGVKTVTGTASKITKKLTKPVAKFFSILNWLKRKIIIIAGIACIGLVFSVVAVLVPLMVIPAILPSGFDSEYAPSADECMGAIALLKMKQMRKDFLKEVEEYCNEHYNPQIVEVPVFDEETGEQVGTEERADYVNYVVVYDTNYEGDNTDLYEELAGSTGINTFFHNDAISGVERKEIKLSVSDIESYKISHLYKAIISMAHIYVDNDPFKVTEFVSYCENMMRSVLDAVNYKNLAYNPRPGVITDPNADIEINGIEVKIKLKNTGLTNCMRLDKSGFDWNYYGNFELAQLYYQYTDEEWGQFGAFFTEDDFIQDYAGSTLSSTSGLTFSSLSEDDILVILSEAGLTEGSREYEMLYNALSNVGAAYSQNASLRMSEHPPCFDCSSFAYRMYKSIGIDIGVKGNWAAAEAEYLNSQGKLTQLSSNSQLKAGDLIFTAGSSNGRYLGIDHVAIYVGNGMIVQATGEKYGVQYKPLKVSSSKEYVVARVL